MARLIAPDDLPLVGEPLPVDDTFDCPNCEPGTMNLAVILPQQDWYSCPECNAIAKVPVGGRPTAN